MCHLRCWALGLHPSIYCGSKSLHTTANKDLRTPFALAVARGSELAYSSAISRSAKYQQQYFQVSQTAMLDDSGGKQTILRCVGLCRYTCYTWAVLHTWCTYIATQRRTNHSSNLDFFGNLKKKTHTLSCSNPLSMIFLLKKHNLICSNLLSMIFFFDRR